MTNQTEHSAAFAEDFDFGIFAEPHFAQAAAKSGLGRKLLNTRLLTRLDVLKGDPTSDFIVRRKGSFLIFLGQHKRHAIEIQSQNQSLFFDLSNFLRENSLSSPDFRALKPDGDAINVFGAAVDFPRLKVHLFRHLDLMKVNHRVIASLRKDVDEHSQSVGIIQD